MWKSVSHTVSRCPLGMPENMKTAPGRDDYSIKTAFNEGKKQKLIPHSTRIVPMRKLLQQSSPTVEAPVEAGVFSTGRIKLSRHRIGRTGVLQYLDRSKPADDTSRHGNNDIIIIVIVESINEIFQFISKSVKTVPFSPTIPGIPISPTAFHLPFSSKFTLHALQSGHMGLP